MKNNSTRKTFWRKGGEGRVCEFLEVHRKNGVCKVSEGGWGDIDRVYETLEKKSM